MAKKQEAPPQKVKKQHKTKASKPLLSRAERLAVEQIRQGKERTKQAKEKAAQLLRDKIQAAADEEERRRVIEATNNWINYWKYIAITYGFCKLEKFENPQPEVELAIGKLFNYGGHNDPRPGIQMLIGEEYYGMINNGHYFIAHNEMVAGDEVE